MVKINSKATKINKQYTLGQGLYLINPDGEMENVGWLFINGWEIGTPENIKTIAGNWLRTGKKLYWCDCVYNRNFDGYNNMCDYPVNSPEALKGISVDELTKLIDKSWSNLDSAFA